MPQVVGTQPLAGGMLHLLLLPALQVGREQEGAAKSIFQVCRGRWKGKQILSIHWLGKACCNLVLHHQKGQRSGGDALLDTEKSIALLVFRELLPALRVNIASDNGAKYCRGRGCSLIEQG